MPRHRGRVPGLQHHVYQVHRPDPETDIDETLSALTDLIHSGKVRAIGSSTTPASDISDAQWVAERRGLERFRTEQPPYSILNRGIEREVLPLAERFGMGTLVWGPLGQGMLTGRARKAGRQTSSGGPTSRPSPMSVGWTPWSSSSRSPRQRACR